MWESWIIASPSLQIEWSDFGLGQAAVGGVEKLWVGLSRFGLGRVALEVALLQRVNRPPVCKAVIKLIEWFDEPGRYILVLERPDPCMDLERFLNNHGQRLDEEKARAIMLQALEAVRHCSRRGVMHGDIKLENFLINTVTSEIKLIDFGCGSLIKGTGCDYAAGLNTYSSPLWRIFI